MIPEHTSRLAVRIVVILVLSGVGNILRPSIERSTGVRAVQMDRVFNISIIGKPHDALCASWDDDGRPRRHAIVAYQPGSTKVRVHLLRKGLDLKLVVPDLLAGDWADDFPVSVASVSRCLRRREAGRSFLLEWLLDGRDWQRNTVD